MKKTFLSLILALFFGFFSGCGTLENRPVHLKLENFTAEMKLISLEVKKISKIDLTECEVGFALEEGYEVLKWGNEESCLILLVSRGQVGQSVFLNSLLSGRFIVASTTDILGPDYPVILVPERSYDLYYLVRVMAHEGLHMERIKNRTNILSDIEEELLAFELQMGIMEKQYTSIQLEDMIIPVPGLPEYYFEALKMEYEIYQAYKKDNLKNYLESISYGYDW